MSSSPLKTTTPTKTGSGVIDSMESGWPGETGIKMLVYGMSGSGKTTFWSTFPGPILVAICSGGRQPGEMRSLDTPDLRLKIKPVILRNTSQLRAVIDEQRETNRFKTVVLDHVSGLQDYALKEVLGLGDDKDLPAQMGWGVASQQQWGQCTAICKEYLRMMLSLSANVVIVGQERSSHSDDAAANDIMAPTVGVATTPSLAGWLNPAVDYIGQMFKRPKMEVVKTTVGKQVVESVRRGKGVEYCLRTAPHDVVTTKFRVPRGQELPEYIVDPSYDKILQILKGS